jgi:hypothetical protein
MAPTFAGWITASPVHKIFATAIENEIGKLPQNSTFKIILAGPAFAGQSFQYNPPQHVPTMEEDFLDQVLNPAQCSSGNPTCDGTLNARLDAFSFHYYGSTAAVLQPSVSLETITGTIATKLQNLATSQTKANKTPTAQNVTSFVSEWGPTIYEDTDINYSHKGAAWAAAFLVEALQDGVQMGSYLILEDGLPGTSPSDPGTSIRGQASLLGKVVAGDGTVSYYPKPAANVFQMFAQMTGTRRPVTVTPVGSSSNLQAFAASDPSSAHVLVYNYSQQLVFNNPDNTDSPENVSVTINHLPFSGAVTVKRYLVDAVTSNFEAFVGNPALNLSPDPTKDPCLQTVEQYPATVVNGQLSLPLNGQPVALGLGATYWQVTQNTQSP